MIAPRRPQRCSAAFTAALCLLVLNASRPAAADDFRRGDANADGGVNIADPVFTLNFLFADGRGPTCGDAADANDDGSLDLSDAAASLNFLFLDAAEPADPGPRDCGPDPTGDALDCEIYEGCPSGSITVLATSPRDGEGGVALTRETIVAFSAPIDPVTVTAESVAGHFAGEVLPARLRVSADGTRVTVFYASPLPASARVRVTVDGDLLRDADGRAVDVDGDGAPGGALSFDFDTLSLTVLGDNVVIGRVFASELGDSGVNVPLEGVVITVDGTEDTAAPLRTVTGDMGNFRLEGAPQGRFFVHVDGRAVTGGFPDGDYYPNVGKAWQTGTSADRETNVGDIFLPLVVAGTLQPVTPGADTTIGFHPSVVEDFPEFAGVSITVPAGSLFFDDGSPGGMVGIAPVASDRLPGTLPPGLEFPLVITVQTDGATNFDVPAPVCFPNLPEPATGEVRAPGERAWLYSFDHDKGRFEPVGPMTVSEDGLLVCTDPGVGIRAPGWHGVTEEPVETDDCATTCSCGGGSGGALNLVPLLDCVLDRDGPGCNETRKLACEILREDYTERRTAWCEANRNSRYQARRTRQMRRRGESFADYCERRTEEQGLNERILCELLFSDGCPAGGGAGGGVGDTESLDAIRSIHDEIDAVLAPFRDSETLPDEVDREVAALLGAADEVAGGSVLALLSELIRQEEAAIDASELELGARFGDVRVEPLLFAAQIVRADGSVLEVRGETEPLGKLRIFVPRDGRVLDVVIYDPRTREIDVVNPRLDGRRLPFPRLAPLPEGIADGDGDSLADLVEFIYGTDPDDPDSDDDGILDGAEVDQGTNALDGRPTRTGIVASVDTSGEAVDVCVADDLAIVADTDAGISVFNVFDGMDPRIVARVDTPGTALAVACSAGRIAVADGVEGLAIVDITDPPAARIVHQVAVAGRARAVAVSGPIAWVGTSEPGSVAAVDLVTGSVLAALPTGADVHDLAAAGDTLYVLTGRELLAVPLFQDRLVIRARAPFQAPVLTLRSRLFVADDGTAYATHLTGYNTFDISSDDRVDTLGVGSTAQRGWRQIVLSGSGLGLAATGPNLLDPPHFAALYDVSNPLETDIFLTQFEMPGSARAVTISSALGYVADGARGLQVVNYLPYDALGNAPAIRLESNFAAGVAEEGQLMRLTARVSDDVQVRSVDFLVDGVLTRDASYPFEHRFTTPLLAVKESFAVQAIARDTGGNETATDLETVQLVADATAPRVSGVAPRFSGRDVSSVIVFFSESVDATSLTAEALRVLAAGPDGQLGTPDDDPVTAASPAYDETIRAGVLRLARPLPDGRYRGVVRADVRDLAGNEIGEDFVWDFRVGLPSAVWTSPESGSWMAASNWSGGTLPGPNDDVRIDVEEDVVVTLERGASATIISLELAETLELGDTLQITGTLEGTGLLRLLGFGGVGRLQVPGVLDPRLDLRLDGGHLVGPTIPAGMDVLVERGGGIIEGVTIEGRLTMTRDSGLVRIAGDLQLEGEVSVTSTSSSAELSFARGPGERLLHGGGTLTLEDSRTGQNASTLGGENVRIGAAMTVLGRRGDLQIDRLVNEGTLRAEAPHGLELITDDFENRGTVGATAGGLVIRGGAWRNHGRFEVSGSGSLLLGGSFSTDDLGAIERAGGGEIRILNATVDNAGRTFTVPETSRPWHFGSPSGSFFQPGVIVGGRVDGAGMVIDQLVLDDVALVGNLSVAGGSVSVRGDLTLEDSTVTIDVTRGGSFGGGQSTPPREARIIGAGEIVFAGGAGLNGRFSSTTSTTIGRGVRVRGTDASATISVVSGDLVIEGDTRFDGSTGARISGDSVINAGVIACEDTASLTVSARSGAWINRGVLRLASTGRTSSGSMTQPASGRLEVVVRSENETARLSGDAMASFALAGALHVEFAAGFDPPIGASWKVVEARSRTGGFAGVTSNLEDGKTIVARYEEDGVTIAVE